MSWPDVLVLVARFGTWTAAVLVAESALLVGVVLPGVSLTAGLGALTATGALPFPVGALRARRAGQADAAGTET